MNNKNRFIIFSTVIIVLIIVSFSSLIVTANTKVSETIVRESESNNAENPSKKFNDIIENRKVRILIDPGHNAATKGALGYLGYEYYMNLRVARELAKILSEDDRFEYFLSREGAYYSRPIKEYMKIILFDATNTPTKTSESAIKIMDNENKTLPPFLVSSSFLVSSTLTFTFEMSAR